MNSIRKSLLSISILVLGCVFAQGRLSAADDPASITPLRVLSLVLKENDVTYVPTNPAVTVFLQFPAPITDYTGRGFSEDPQQTAGDFFVRLVDGDSYLTIAPLTDGAERTLHIVCEGRGYPIHFFPATSQNAWDKVIFTRPDAPKPVSRRLATDADNDEKPFAARRSVKQPRQRRIPTEQLSSDRLLGMIDMMRLLSNLPTTHARSVVSTNPALSLSVSNTSVQDYGDYTVTLHFALRNETFDAVGFAVTLENTTRKSIDFVRDSFTVRAGEHVYHAIASDFTAHLGSRGKITSFFVIAGNGTGGWNDLSVDNAFSISFDVQGKTEAHPTSTLDIPAPGGSDATDK